MVLIVVWVVVALVAAAAVLVGAAWLTTDTAPATFFADLRSGLQTVRGRRGVGGTRSPGVIAGARRDLADVADVETSSVGDIFRVGRPTEHDYLDATQLTAGLVRTIDRVAHHR